MNKSVLNEMSTRSTNGTITFPEVVQTLIKEGIESYHVDVVRAENRYYMPNGDSHLESVLYEHPAPAQNFLASEVKAAIKAIQCGDIKYQEFMNRIISAGTVYYIVYLTGKKVIYFGREGDFHIELFPQK